MTIDQIREVLELAEFTPSVRSGNVVIKCPFAALGDLHKHAVDRHPSLGFLPTEEGAIWNCFTCKRRGNFTWFFVEVKTKLEGYDVEKAEAKLKVYLEEDLGHLAESLPEFEDHTKKDPRREYPTFPESWLAPYKGKVPRYIVDRGVLLATCKAWQIGYDKPRHRVLYPVRDFKKQLVGAVGGLTRPIKYEPKYKNYWHRIHKTCGRPLEHRDGEYLCPFCDDQKVRGAAVREGFRKSNFLFGEHMIKPKRVLVVVEGIVDVLMTWQVLVNTEFFPVAIFGSAPSVEQAEKIVRLTSERKVIMMLDPDNAGIAGMKDLSKMVGRRLRVFRADYSDLPSETDSEGVIKKPDPGSMTKEQILTCLKNAKVLL